jgi:hypothetical protein
MSYISSILYFVDTTSGAALHSRQSQRPQHYCELLILLEDVGLPTAVKPAGAEGPP